MRQLAVLLLTLFLFNAKKLKEIENEDISSWWNEEKYGSAPTSVSVLWVTETENRDFGAHLKRMFSNDFSEGGNAKVCSAGAFKTLPFFEKFQESTLKDKKICAKFEAIKFPHVDVLVSSIKEVEMQLKMKSVAEKKTSRCFSVPDIVPQVVVWKVSADPSYKAVKFMERVEPILVSTKRMMKSSAKASEFKKKQVERFLTKYGSTCAADMFDFFQELQQKNLFPVDVKVGNLGFVTGSRGFEISKLMFFDLGDNHFMGSIGTYTPAVIRSQFRQYYSRFKIVGDSPDTFGFNPVFFELNVLLLGFCFASEYDSKKKEYYDITHEDDFLSDESSQVKVMCKRTHECINKHPSFKTVFSKLSNQFKSMKKPVEKKNGKEFELNMKRYACE